VGTRHYNISPETQTTVGTRHYNISPETQATVGTRHYNISSIKENGITYHLNIRQYTRSSKDVNIETIVNFKPKSNCQYHLSASNRILLNKSSITGGLKYLKYCIYVYK
jgi:hypothetical protein